VGRNTLNCCYNGRTVSSPQQLCTGNVTAWGKANLVQYDGTVENDLFRYSYGGVAGAAAHSRCKGKFTASKILSTWYPLLSVWGHPDGTSTVKAYPFCEERT
jgi:hypothetical protein